MSTVVIPFDFSTHNKPIKVGKFFKLDDNETIIFAKKNEKFEVWKNGTVSSIPTPPITYINKNLTYQIFEVFYPKKWKLEKIAKPSISCRQKTVEIAIFLLENFELYPDRVRANVEEGITLFYKNYENEKEIVLEVYNTLEMAILLNKNKKIISCTDFEKEDEDVFKKVIRFFKQ